MLSNSWLVSCWSLVMSALACIPNTSGCGIIGRDLMYSRYCSYYKVRSQQDHFKHKIAYIAIIWGIVYATTRELVAWGGYDIWAVVLVEYTNQCASVPVIRHTTAIVTLAGEVTYGIKWNFLHAEVNMSHLLVKLSPRIH